MTEKKMVLADLQESAGSSARKQHTLEHTISTTGAATKRTYDYSESQQLGSKRDALASYRKQFTPIFAMDTVRVEPLTNRKGEGENHPRRKLNFGEEQLRPQPTTTDRHIDTPIKHTTRKFFGAEPATLRTLKQTILQEDLRQYSRPANLQYELRKKRFFECFQRKPEHSQSYSQLAKKLRLNY